MGNQITKFILLRASLGDAVMITILCLPFIFFKKQERKNWLIILMGVVLAIFIELYALETGRWSYNEYMPIIPFLDIGLTPTIQLGLLGYLSYRIVVKKYS